MKGEVALRQFRTVNTKRIATGILGFMLFVIILFATLLINEQVDHDCIGDNCPVCACVAECENALRQVGGGIGIQITIFVSIVFALFLAFFFTAFLLKKTPVLKKVRLNI